MEELETKLIEFAKANRTMIAANEQAYKGSWGLSRSRQKIKVYTREEVEKIINEGSLDEQLALSRNYFEKDSLYRRIIIYYRRK